ncbi:MAG: PASTA domain-containing protein, partial [bacterium]
KPSVPIVPDLLYRHISEASMLLAQYGLVVGDIVLKYESTYPPGTILNQEPSSGVRVEEGCKVALTVATDEPNKPLSFTTGLDQPDRIAPSE